MTEVYVALIRESDAIMRPTKVVTLDAHLAALEEQARAATTAALATSHSLPPTPGGPQ